jgi:hypothetical protein
VKAWRILLAISGVLLGLFGLFRLFTEIPPHSLVGLAIWLGAALIIHDWLFLPTVVGLGWLLRRFVPDRGRRYFQAALVMAAAVTVIALPMIYLRGSQPAVKALLLRPYGPNLLVILGLIAVVTSACYAVRVARDRGSARAEARPERRVTNVR